MILAVIILGSIFLMSIPIVYEMMEPCLDDAFLNERDSSDESFGDIFDSGCVNDGNCEYGGCRDCDGSQAQNPQRETTAQGTNSQPSSA